MEKLEVTSSSHTTPGERTLAERFVHPFGQVTIQRRLHHFDKVLALTPGVAGEFNLEILTRLFTGQRSHQAILRQQLGDRHYRNFANLIRGNSEPVPETVNALAHLCGLSPADIMAMSHGQKQGPLLPQFLQALQMAEGLFSEMYRRFTAGSIPCPCCGENILDDTQAFWHRQTSVRLNPAEYLFVERCLTAFVGCRAFKGLASEQDAPSGTCFSFINPDPMDSRQYPVGNWLQAVRDAYRCSNNLDLEKKLAALPTSRAPSSPVTQLRLNKWACGEDLIPLDLGKSMVQSLPNTDDLGHGLLEARIIAFLQEFVSAAALGAAAPPLTAVRFVVHERAEQLANKFRLNLRQGLRRYPPANETGGLTSTIL